jgi:two-component system sensor histidine kinase YesM
VKVSPNGYLVLMNQDGMLYAKSPEERYGLGDAGTRFLRQHLGDSGSFQLNNDKHEKMFVVFESLRASGWVLAAVVPERDILDKASHIQYFTAGVVCVLIVVSSVIATLLAGGMSNSIRLLARQVRKLEQGDFDVQFELRDHHEIGILSRGLSHLAETVKMLLDQVMEEQDRKRQMELLALQSQITPHFLYNTLGSIRQLIEMKDLERAGKMVGALTKFCMIGVSRGKEMITLREELDHLEYYLQIQKMRYSRDFDYVFEVDPSLLDCTIPKLTLQPIIENAIYHGIKNKRGKGCIRVTTIAVQDDLDILIFDDGPGMSAERLEKLNTSIRMEQVEETPITYGLRNAHHRVRLCFGASYGITIESEEKGYTLVRVRIPQKPIGGDALC